MRPRSRTAPWMLVGPSLLLLFVFVLCPLALAFGMSLFSWDLLTPPRAVGFRNYEVLWARGELWALTLRTLAYAGLVVLLATTLGLVLALLLNRPGKIFAFVRGSVFSAYVVSWVSVALLWMWMLDADQGLFSRVARAMGFGRMGFLTDPRLVLLSLAGITTWKIAGYAMILFLSGLQAIPRSYYEAAALDGAGKLAQFRYVTWPLLRPTFAFVGTTSVIISFQAFDVVRIITQGGPAKASTLFVYAIYEEVFLNLSIGKATALTSVFFLLLAALSALQVRAWRLGERAG